MKTDTKTQSVLNARIRSQLILIAIISFLILLVGIKASAQKIDVNFFAEQNIVGLQKGATVSTIIKNKLRFGYFYQSSDKISLEKDIYNYSFHGFHASFPIKSCDGLSLHGGLKAGLVNSTFLVITPQVTT
ncbi:MAG: hypothetical protein ACJAVY_000408 [Marinoscillum sp.]|jgi:hypothetical protein